MHDDRPFGGTKAISVDFWVSKEEKKKEEEKRKADDLQRALYQLQNLMFPREKQ